MHRYQRSGEKLELDVVRYRGGKGRQNGRQTKILLYI